ncbi:hypothetical protein [Streptomyces sp. NPDC048636]|uniref:hypothetical protein n=1 Tax=Streptomyces sp. NPDC048636 TaxID=3155762 RepID=UPI003444396A
MNEPLPYRPGEPVTDWSAREVYQPVPVPLDGPVELAAERGPVVWVPDPYDLNRMVAVRRIDLPTVQMPAPVPAPTGLDPQAQRLIARGVLALGVGGAVYLGAAGLAIAAPVLVPVSIAVAAVVVAPVFSGFRRGRGDTFITHHHVTNRWWGRSHTTVRNR